MTVFEAVKDRADPADVLALYGLHPDKANMISCPFHGKDEHPSMRMYKDGFYCFACGWHGDTIALAAQMDGSTPFEAAKKLNDALHLGVEFDKPTTKAETDYWQSRAKLKAAEAAWDAMAEDILRAEVSGETEKAQRLREKRDQLDKEITALSAPFEPSAIDIPEHSKIDEGFIWAENGVYFIFTPPKGQPQMQYICHTGIQIQGVYADEDTGLHAVVLRFHDGLKHREEPFDRRTLTDPQLVKALSGYGVTITDYRQMAVAFALRLHNQPVSPASSRLGWFESEFVPFSSSIVCLPRSSTTNTMLQAVRRPHGDPDKWQAVAAQTMAASRAARFAVAASLASPLLAKAKYLGFGVHLFGKSGTGKTVFLMLAASVWGLPQELVKSMASTAVGMEKTAAFLCNLPLMLDELQEVQNKDLLENVIYMLSNGKSKTRGTKDGGIASESRWLSVAITTGEQAILDDNVCTGAENRIISVDATGETYGAEHGAEIVEDIAANYGHAGRRWTSWLKSPANVESVRQRAAEVRRQLRAGGYLDKQLLSVSLLLATSEAAQQVLFPDNTETALTEADVLPLLTTSEEADRDKKGVEYIKEWIVQNAKSFEGAQTETPTKETFGRWDGNICWLIASKWQEVLKKAGFSPKDVFAEAVRMGVSQWVTDTERRYSTASIRVNGKKIRCIQVRFKEDFDDENGDELPF